jgi:two-component sensor histidine kinase
MSQTQQGLDPLLSDAIISTISEPMVVLNEDLRVIVASRAFYEKFHTEYKDAHDELFYELGNGQWNIPQLRKLLEKVIPEKKIVEGYEVEHDFEHLGKRVMIINAREIDYKNGQKKMLLSINDITDSSKLMKQKDTLLREMRHRIANSLQLIASVILLKAGTVHSEESRHHLEDAHDRILSIATVQRNLDPTGDNDAVPIVEYLTTLCQSLAKSMIGGRKPITLTVSGGTGTATPDEAIGLGLITTELVMNALKHAFPSGVGGVTVTYEASGPSWNLSISDNGVGLAATAKANKEGLGTNIIESLANQLNADIQRESSSRGTTVSIIHPRVLVTHAQPLVATNP